MTENSNEKSEIELVSVIVPTYNYGHFISETLKSLLLQTYPHWECIVVDNGSSDNTKSIVEGFAQEDSRFRYLFIEHSTTSKSRNVGLQAAKGKFIQFLDADDQIEEGKLFNQIELFRENPDAELVYSHALYYDDGEPTKKRFTHDESNVAWMPKFTGKSWEIFPQQYKRNIFVISSPLIKKSLINKSGGFYDPLNWVEDWEFYLRILGQNQLIVFDPSENSNSLIRVHKKSLSRNRVMMFEQSLIARKRLITFLHQMQLQGFENGNELLHDNVSQESFIYKLLYQQTIEISKRKAFNYLFQYAKRKGDWLILIRFLLGIFNKKFPMLNRDALSE